MAIRYHQKQSWVLRYGTTILLSLLVQLLLFVMMPLFNSDVPISLTIIVVTGAAWFFGLWPGIAATIIGVLGGLVLFLSPWDGSATITNGQSLRLFFFLLTGSVISLLSESVQQVTIAWRRAEQDKERLVLEERNRMAREIHDTLAQGLTGIVLQLEAAEDCLSDDPPAVQAHLTRAVTLARLSLSEARRSVQDLRPVMLEQRTLSETLTYYTKQMTDGTRIMTSIQTEGDTILSSRLSPSSQSELLRIGLEAITNVVKHAGARHLWVMLSFEPEQVRLTVQDDGKGIQKITPYSSGFGLLTMKERAQSLGATFTCSGRPGKGTEVTVCVPLPMQPPLSGVTNGKNKPH